MEVIVQVMESTIGARDPYTVGHQQRVTQIACAIGQQMGLDEERLQLLKVAGSLHDLGKIAVPLEILAKPGRLSPHEFAIIKAHPQVGCDILQPLNLPEQIGQVILQHHERLDGSGYPQGLKSRKIILESRILAVADVVEAMCSHRPYRPALGLKQALGEITANQGILYDREVVTAILHLSDNSTLFREFVAAEPARPTPTAYLPALMPGLNGPAPDLQPGDSGGFLNSPLSQQARFYLQSLSASLIGGIIMLAAR